MLPKWNKIKGIHPGLILKRELKAQDIKASELALTIGEHKQTISAIIHKKRDITPQLSIKLAKKFNIAEDYFMLLQASYNVKKVNEEKNTKSPNLNNIRKVIFWDTDIHKIDWQKNSKAVIKRILERGNHKEIKELIAFYGKNYIAKQIKNIKNTRLPSFNQNIEKYKLR